jgi:hypothetical protein
MISRPRRLLVRLTGQAADPMASDGVWCRHERRNSGTIGKRRVLMVFAKIGSVWFSRSIGFRASKV